MKYILVVLILVLTSACLSVTKKGKLTRQENKSEQERTIAATAQPGDFIYFIHNDIHSLTRYLNQQCDSSKAFSYASKYNTVICIKK